MIYGEKNPPIREIIFALEEERQWMELVREDGKPYSKLIDFLLMEPVYNEDSDREFVKRMTVSSYAARLGEKQSSVNKWLRQIYTDIFELNQKHPELFVNPGEQMCTFHYYSEVDKSGFRFNLGQKCILALDLVPGNKNVWKGTLVGRSVVTEHAGIVCLVIIIQTQHAKPLRRQRVTHLKGRLGFPYTSLVTADHDFLCHKQFVRLNILGAYGKSHNSTELWQR